MDENNLLLLIFQLAVLLFSVIIHEISHGAVAERLGDPTARLAGRLTLNPISHLDFFGSFLLPLSLFLFSGGQFVFGWAKPVPYNPFNLKNPARGGGLIAAAGPLSNLLIAVIFGAFLRWTPVLGLAGIPPLIAFVNMVILINIALAVFNLVPLPPLDGSKVLFAFLPRSADGLRVFLEQYGFALLLFFIFFGFKLIEPPIFFLYRLIAGSAGAF